MVLKVLERVRFSRVTPDKDLLLVSLIVELMQKFIFRYIVAGPSRQSQLFISPQLPFKPPLPNENQGPL